ncbi:hypothetical protein [Fusobacterium varium]|uniref:hypothetical protein n=1 Tax=Fusobacterium varium TaxID=856 RepID=UPI00242BE104|nr:hypothetical protein [Fusobacterium varium]
MTVHCPERVLPGKILYELEHNDRIIGAAGFVGGYLIDHLKDDMIGKFMQQN